MECDKKMCKYCKKNITSINFKCLYCEKIFCVKHRLPEDHECSNDYKKIIKICKTKIIEPIIDNHNLLKI